ncbi:hypothetical protein [Nocardioides sp.]|uniref:hypothetical protein n=1 Tax=Nocardioides sp. TaxID=35761 RepID=UPI003D110884
MTPESVRLLAGLVQPDQRTCGSATLVAARMLNRPDYLRTLSAPAGPLSERFRTETLQVHRRTSGMLDAQGRAQLPWPRALGTAPWSLVRELDASAGVPGTTYRARLVLPRRRGSAFVSVRAALEAGHVTPLYVGNRLSPRHVVLALEVAGHDVVIYDPAHGRTYPITRADFVAGRLDVAGWRVPWLVVLPRRGRRSRA